MKPLFETPTERLDRVTHPLTNEGSLFGGLGMAVMIGVALVTAIVLAISWATSGFGNYYNTIQDLAS